MNTGEFWHGLDIDFWSPIQTLSPPRSVQMNLYAGYDPIDFGSGYDFVEQIPLAIRYQSFKRRLAKALANA